MESSDFGRTLRAFRDRVTAAAVGLPVGTRRRASGLRREELAALSGISTDYLIRLEQGRSTSPSDQVIEALSRALRLSDPDRELLFSLAGLRAPGPGVVSARIPPSVQRLLDRLDGNPIAVWDAMWNLVITNAPYEALMGETTSWRGLERNGLWRRLTGHGSRAVQTPQEEDQIVENLVADLRLVSAKYPSDHRLQQLITSLRSGSSRFVELWDTLRLSDAPDTGRQKTIAHPSVGEIEVDCDTLVVSGSDLRIMVYSAEPGTTGAERLSLAVVLGTQSLTT
jgi:transcriptional regulator with XRE-family HTH domain